MAGMLAMRSLESVVDKIYWAAGEGGSWSEVAGDIRLLSGAVSCSLQIRQAATTRILGAAGYKDFQPALYELTYAQKDIRAQALMRLPANEPHLLHHHLSQEAFLGSDYYNDFFRHVSDGHWSAAAWLTFEPEAGLGIGIHRAKDADPDDNRQIRVLRFLGAHLRRAGRLYMKLNDIELRLGQLSAALDHISQPAIVVGSNGRVMVMNRAAEALFCPPHALSIDASGRLALHSASDTCSLHRAIERAAGPPEREAGRNLEIVIDGSREGGRLAISILPLTRGRNGGAEARHDSAMLLFKDFAAERVSLEALQQAFGLTPAETRLTALLANGSSLRTAAATLGVSYWTVMTQVKSCYQKTGTHRQAELVSLALRLGAR
jgi:DNA-binding CsgD family transcriptional regulator/PAS domain-containing protein